MGLFDRFRRKPGAPAGDEGDHDEPRMAHYVFAHIALRQLALADPMGFLGILVSERCDEFLAAVRARVEKQMGEPIPDGSMPVTRGRAGDYPCAIVAPPPPLGMTEAYLVALVVTADLSDPDAIHGEIPGRYFTLEKGMKLDGSPRTVLCEWTAEGQHNNYGDGPEPTPAAFAAAIERLIGREAGNASNPG